MSLVYFITCNDFVKIGVSRGPVKRLLDMQTSSPYGLDLAGVMDGGRTLERELHERFQRHRTGGEWFWFAPEIREYIDANAYRQPKVQRGKKSRRKAVPRTAAEEIRKYKKSSINEWDKALGITPREAAVLDAIDDWEAVQRGRRVDTSEYMAVKAAIRARTTSPD